MLFKKNNKAAIADLEERLDDAESNFRANVEVQVDGEYVEALAMFRHSLGIKRSGFFDALETEDDNTSFVSGMSASQLVTPASTKSGRRSRLSTASSQRSRLSAQSSLSPLMEEDGDTGSLSEEEDHSTPSAKRRKTDPRKPRPNRKSAGTDTSSDLARVQTSRIEEEDEEMVSPSVDSSSE